MVTETSTPAGLAPAGKDGANGFPLAGKENTYECKFDNGEVRLTPSQGVKSRDASDSQTVPGPREEAPKIENLDTDRVTDGAGGDSEMPPSVLEPTETPAEPRAEAMSDPESGDSVPARAEEVGKAKTEAKSYVDPDTCLMPPPPPSPRVGSSKGQDVPTASSTAPVSVSLPSIRTASGGLLAGSKGAGNLAVSTLGPGPNQALLDSPVLLPMMTHAEPSPTTGMSIPLFQNQSGCSSPKFGGLVMGKGQTKMQESSRAGLPPPSPSKHTRGSADDGYQWRKYGEKTVKGSVYPRSYFKCSHQGCPVKKIVERDRVTGLIKENLYKGQHTHPPPNPSKLLGRSSSLGRATAKGGPAAAVQAKQAANVASAMANGNGSFNGASDHHLRGHESEASRHEAEAATRQALASPLKGYNPFVSPLLDSIGDIANGASWRAPGSSGILPVSPLAGKKQHRHGQQQQQQQIVATTSVVNRSEVLAKLPAASALLAASKAAADEMERAGSARAMQGRRAMNSDVMKEMQNAISHATMMREARADEKSNILTTQPKAAAAAAMFLNSRLPTSQDSKDQSSGVPDLSGQKRPADLPTPTAPSASKKRKSDAGAGGRTPPTEEEPLGPPESPSVVPARLAEMQKLAGLPGKEPKLALCLKMEADILEDGYRWRKYGQKLVKGNKYPRSYYKCTTQNCSVRKHVERSGQEPTCVIGTYEGIHNHALPPTGSVASNKKSSRKSSDSAAPRPTPPPLLQKPAQEPLGVPAPVVKEEQQAEVVPTALNFQSATTTSPQAAAPAGGEGSPVTPKTKKVTSSMSLPISSIFNGDDDSRSGLRLEAAASPNTSNLNLDLGFKSSEKRSKLAGFGGASGLGGMDTPTGALAWDPNGFLNTPKSEAKMGFTGNISLPTPPGSSLTPPSVLDLPSSNMPLRRG